MLVIIAVENHPDRFIHAVYGPYESDDDAMCAVARLERDGHAHQAHGARRFNYFIHDVETP